MPIGAIFKLVGGLGLIGLAVAAVLGAAIIVIPVVALSIIGWLIYKRTRARPRYRPSQW